MAGENMNLKKWWFEEVIFNLFCTEGKLDPKYAIPEEPEVEIEEVPDTVPETNSPLYRPLSFNDYIGQDKSKNILKSFIKGTKKFDKTFPHTIIYGNAGCGKTTLARIIANELKIGWIELLAQDIGVDEFLSAIREVDGGIIFLDEVHRMKRDTVEQLYSLMEDFMWNGQPVTPFTLIGATTEIGEIIKTRRPFYDRHKIIIELEDYTTDDMYKIIDKYIDKTYPDEPKAKAKLLTIAENSRYTPRKSIRLADYLYYSDLTMDEVLRNNNIIEKGYMVKDLKVLDYLKKVGHPVGVDCLALYLDVPTVTYNYEVEPYLIKMGAISRTPRGRTITEKGKKILENLKKVQI